MKTRKKLLLSFTSSLGISALVLTACGDGGEDSPSSENGEGGSEEVAAGDCTPTHEGVTTFTDGVLTVGVPENLPYSGTEGGDGVGVDIEVLKLVAEEQCWDLSYEPITYANGIPMITEQQITDIITGGWYFTEERATQVEFTSPLWYDRVAVISTDGLNAVDELEEAGPIGTMTGAAYTAEMTAVIGSDLQTYPGPQEMRQDLDAGRIQAGLEGFSVATSFYEDTDYTIEVLEPDERVTSTVEPPVIALPLDPENEALNEVISSFIDEWREDGTLLQILEDYDQDPELLVPAEEAANVTPMS